MQNPHDRAVVLEHPVRAAIFDLAQREPGIDVTALFHRLPRAIGRERFGMGCLSYHLYRLERAGVLASRRSGRYRRFYEARSPIGDPTALSALQVPRALPMARCIASQSPMRHGELVRWNAATNGSSRQIVSYHAKRLRDVGLLLVHRRGREVVYEATTKLHQLLAFIDAAQAPDGR